MAAPTGYPRSYYAHSMRAPLGAPSLKGEVEAEICVIGGGFSGVATALTLAERGHDVALMEANLIGWGASGRNGGQVLPGWSGEGEMTRQLGARAAEFFERTRYRGNEIIEERLAKYSIDCDYVKGAATVALNAKQQRALEKEFAEARSASDHLELVDRAGLRQHVSSDAYVGGLIDRRAAHCHPLNLCLGEAEAAKNLGVRIYEQTPVERVIRGATATVETAAGAVRAKFVILAGNAHHELELDDLLGMMLPAQTYVITTAPIGEAAARAVLPSNLSFCDANWVLDYFRRTADHRVLFGGLCTYNNREIADVEGAIGPRLRRILPALKEAPIEFAWGGVIGIPLNRVPLIGALDKNYFYVQGYSGHGVNCSHIAAEILADAVEAECDGVELFEAVRHFRIPAADIVGGPMLALGMTWFRLRDALGV